MGKAEATIEQYLKAQCTKKRWLCWKFTSPNLRGVPDRIVVANNIVSFVECKSPTGRLRPQQKLRIAELEERNIPTFVVSTKEEVLETIEKIEAMCNAKTGHAA